LRQHRDLDWLEIRYGVQFSKRLVIEGLSGKDTLTDADIQKILGELADPKIPGLGVSAIDRLTRPKDFHGYGIFERFVEVRKCIWSRREGHIEPWTPEGHDKCINAGQRARAELEEIRRRTMDEKLVLAKLGVQCAATAPYGYRFQKSARREGTWVIRESEAKIVRECYRRAAVLGWTGYRIAQWLNQEKIPSATGKQWVAAVVRQTLNNPAYIGKARFARGKAHEQSITVPAILVGEQVEWWDRVQATRAKNREALSGRPSPNYLFQNLSYCRRCSHRLTGRRGGHDRRAYECSHFDLVACKRLCLAPQISCETLDNAVWAALIARLSDPEMIAEMLRDYRDRQQKAVEPVGPSQADRLAKLRRDESAAKRILADGDLLDMWEASKKRLLVIQVEIATLERELARLAKVLPMPAEPTIRSFARDVAEVGSSRDYAERRGLVERLVTRVTYADGEFEVEGRLVLAQSSIKPRVQNRYSCVGANSQRQGNDRHQGEAWILPQRAQRIPEIVEHAPRDAFRRPISARASTSKCM
jgi:hypothetical protein